MNFGRVAFAPLIEPFMRTFGIGEATAGLVATLVWFGSAAPRLPTGYLLTRVRRHRVILGMGVFLTLAAAFTAGATTIALVGTGAFLVGVASGVFYIAANPLVSELYPERMGLAIGVRGMSAQLAAMGAPLLIGVALAVGSWRLVFQSMAVVAVFATAAFAFAASTATLPAAGVDDRDLLGAVRAQWPLVLTGIALVGAAGFVWQGVFNFYVSYLTNVKGYEADAARTLLTVLFAAGVPAFVFTGRLADRVSLVPLLLVILAGFVATLAALPLAEGWTLVALSIVMGYVIHSLFPVVDTYMLASLPDDNRASAYAAYSAAMMLIQAPGSVVLGTLVERGVGYDAVFATYAAALGCLLVGLLVTYRAGWLPAGGRATA